MKDEQLYYFEKSPVFKAMMHFSLPMMIGTLLSVIYGILNIYFIGFLEDSHMISAISSNTASICYLMGLGNLFGVGAGTYISRLLRCERLYVRVKFVSSFSIYGGIALGLIVILVTLPFSDQIAAILGARGETLALTSNYLKVMFLSATFCNFVLHIRTICTCNWGTNGFYDWYVG